MDELRVSVIIIAYNRKDFIYQAINSVINQKIDPSSFEIIIVSNFVVNTDVKFQVTNILMDGTMGEFLFAGMMKARYEIVAFLDDDDFFEPNKLGTVINVFSSDAKICYYHNSQRYVSVYLRPINYTRLVERKSHFSIANNILVNRELTFHRIKDAIVAGGDFNLSSIAIKKDCYLKYLPLLKQIKSNPDGFFFWMGLISLGRLMIDNMKLTNYRVHELNVSGQITPMTKNLELQKEIFTYDLILKFLEETNYQSKIIESLTRWISLFKYEYELMSLVFAGSSRVAIMKQIKKLLFIGMRYSNTLKYRVLLFALMGIINVKFAQKFYLRIKSITVQK